MFKSSDLSVVIPSYNSRRTIEACLESILAQESLPGEIIVVDSSEDGTAEIIVRKFPGVQVRAIKSQIFPGPARNIGAKLASGSIIAFTDADCLVRPGWIQGMVAGHNLGHQVVGGSISIGNPQSDIAWAGYIGEFREFIPFGVPRSVMHIPTCNISYRKSLFDQYGGFPDAYYPQEDLLFNYMLNLKGIKVWFDPSIQVDHLSREKLLSYLSHQHRIGRVTRSTLSRVELPGSTVARIPRLAYLVSPILGTIKYLRSLIVVLFRFPRQAVRHPQLFGFLALGAMWWARGFAAGARRGLSGRPGWRDPDEPIFSMLVQVREQTESK